MYVPGLSVHPWLWSFQEGGDDVSHLGAKNVLSYDQINHGFHCKIANYDQNGQNGQKCSKRIKMVKIDQFIDKI